MYELLLEKSLHRLLCWHHAVHSFLSDGPYTNIRLHSQCVGLKAQPRFWDCFGAAIGNSFTSDVQAIRLIDRVIELPRQSFLITEGLKLLLLVSISYNLKNFGVATLHLLDKALEVIFYFLHMH